MANIERAERYERAFLSLSAVMLVLFLGALAYAALHLGIHLPGRAGQIDPKQVRSTAPFDEPGIRQVAPGEYEVVMVAQAWAYTPSEIEIPAGSRVTFLITSMDVVHGFDLEGTRVNVMILPGQITRTTYTFEEPGTHYMICHEYCGVGHHTMYGTIRVTEGSS